MKGAFQPASVPITIFVFFLGICITEIHRNSHHGIFGPQIQSDNYRITGELRNVHGGRQWKHQFLGIFDNRFRVNQQSNSEKESNENQYHEGNANQRQRFTTRTYPATNQERTWCICNSVRSNTLATRASSPECYVCKQDIKSYGKWNIIEWEKDYTSPGYCNSTVVTIMHICIWETCKVYSVSQEHQRNSSTCECASIHIHGSFINRRANYYSRKNTNLQFRNQNHGTIAISENQFEHEISTNGNAYQLSWEILCETFCHETGTMLSMSTIWTFSSCMFSKEGTLQYVQWTSSYSAVSRKNLKLRIGGSKMCKLWRETFCKQQSLQCSPGKNAAENEQCNVTHTCHQTISATTSYIDRIPSYTYRGHRHQEESHVRQFSQRSQQLCSCCCKTSCSEVCGAAKHVGHPSLQPQVSSPQSL